MGETKKGNGFSLPGGTVTIKFIKRKKGIAANVKDDHIISGGMLEGASRKFPLPMLRSGGLKNVLTKEEKEYFETNDYDGQNLSVYGDFWKDFYVSLEKLNTTLNLSQADDYIRYKLLLGWDQVIAPSLKVFTDAPTAAYQFYLEREGEEEVMSSNTLNETKTAWKNFNKIEDNADVLSAVIFLMTGKVAARNAKITYLNNEVEKLVDKKATKFNSLIADAQFETKIMLANAERAGIIKRVKGAYETEDGLPLTQKGQPATVQNVTTFINDPLNNEVKELILSRLDNIKE